jgi:hypothetical protein
VREREDREERFPQGGDQRLSTDMTRASPLLVSILLAACAANPAPPPKAAERPDSEDGPPRDPSAEPLFVAAKRICRLVDHKDDGVLAVAFAPGFFDTTPPAKLDAAFYEVRGALGHCGDKMKVIERASPLEGVVAVECEHGVLLLSIGLDITPLQQMMALGLDMRPGSTMRDVQPPPPSRTPPR